MLGHYLTACAQLLIVGLNGSDVTVDRFADEKSRNWLIVDVLVAAAETNK